MSEDSGRLLDEWARALGREGAALRAAAHSSELPDEEQRGLAAVFEAAAEVFARAARRARPPRTRTVAVRPDGPHGDDELVDEASDESFPASDPPEWTAGTR